MTHFLPVKITDSQWADRLVAGEVFMRPLHDFGVWNSGNKVESLKNNYRSDHSSGTAAIFQTPDDCEFFADVDEDFKNCISECYYLDDSDIKYYKIFSLYRYEFDDNKGRFKTPDLRMMQFGDTAVIITDFCTFLQRSGIAMANTYERVSGMLGVVETFSLKETRTLNPLFSAEDSHAYQNELRLALCELKRNRFAHGPGANDALEIVRDLTPVKLQLGDLSDITLKVPVGDFICGSLPEGFEFRWPSSEDQESPSNYDALIEWTKEQMDNYKSVTVKPMVTIRRSLRTR